MALKARTVLFGGLGLALVAALGYVAVRSEPAAVDLHEITKGRMQVTVNADGKTRIRELFDVAAPIAGTVQRAPVRVGDLVVKDETVVAVVEPGSSNLLDARTRMQAEAAVREAEAALHLARSRLREAGEDLALAQSEHDRAKTLVERGAASATRLEYAEQTLNIKQASESAAISALEMRKSALDRARAALLGPDDEGGTDGWLEVTAPATGHVLHIDVLSERPVLPGTKLMSIGQPGDLEIVADLLSADAVRLKPGARAIVERWGGPEALEARISKIEPSAYTKVSALGIEEQRVDVVFDFTGEPGARAELGDGFAVFLRIVEWEAEDVLTVPLGAVFRLGADWAVFVAEDGMARTRTISLGRRNGAVAQVLDGLVAGERVITHPSDDIADGTPITER